MASTDDRATLVSVARAAGVSRQTVSNALHAPDKVAPETLERVQEAIERLGYSPNRAARNLRTRSSHLIGLRYQPAQEGTSEALMDARYQAKVARVNARAAKAGGRA